MTPSTTGRTSASNADSAHGRESPRLRGLRGLAVAAAMTLGLLAGCATSSDTPPDSMRDPQADFGAYRTFGWQGTGATADAASRADSPSAAASTCTNPPIAVPSDDASPSARPPCRLRVRT